MRQTAGARAERADMVSNPALATNTHTHTYTDTHTPSAENGDMGKVKGKGGNQKYNKNDKIRKEKKKSRLSRCDGWDQKTGWMDGMFKKRRYR